ncbi:murein L,D-transpeptidase [Roseovarius faecimaris]|uniref:Murein L,D-transpeptidase n=1 Tax=Roseovarius faecimaris TaxID=2494550 RepID=A0A6I6IS77_9RHOB|nr:L,D-transpeptidase family protein [Roseovarius faecimaris]QGX98156.1 murein L,D-transpeptidase [Roseovarius faecimaris]
MILGLSRAGLRGVALAVTVAVAQFAGPAPVAAGVTAFKQAVAEAASSDRDVADFYRENNYEPVWTGADEDDAARRQALFLALSGAQAHGLPLNRYDADALYAMLRDVGSPRDRGLAEVALTKTFLRFAQDLRSGALIPAEVVRDIKREVTYDDRTKTLERLSRENPRAFFRSLTPGTTEYARLMKEKARLEHLITQGGWGPTVQAKSLEPGDTGTAVFALRNRLIAMGYLRRSASASYDGLMQKAVQQFQEDHGLNTDGVAGATTMKQINVSAEERLKSVIVAMERERWFNKRRGYRHVLVNLTDFSARIVENDRIAFATRAVVGKNVSDRRSPEFSDVMEFMVINPTWNVPRSIATKEYLPMMKRNPNAAGHLRLYDSRGRVVNRANINFAAYTARNFPYAIKQPPSSRNALGLVKFMFPNKYNIYLHDTPQKSLFARDVRAFSHGCIRLQQPFEFAYELLSKQTDDPEGLFHSKLRTGAETKVDLEQPLPVHIMYRTAFIDAKGRAQYRDDVYGRDALIWQALEREGVSLPDIQG